MGTNDWFSYFGASGLQPWGRSARKAPQNVAENQTLSKILMCLVRGFARRDGSPYVRLAPEHVQFAPRVIDGRRKTPRTAYRLGRHTTVTLEAARHLARPMSANETATCISFLHGQMGGQTDAQRSYCCRRPPGTYLEGIRFVHAFHEMAISRTYHPLQWTECIV